MKFRPELAKLILEKKKYVSWRVNDDKDFRVGDEVELLIWKELTVFAKARITKVKLTTFGKLTDEDKAGHETFSSDKEMYDTYAKYYGFPIKPTTELKIVWFELVD